MDFETFHARQSALWAAMDAAGKRLNAIPGVGTGAMGLTPDSVKQSYEFRKAKREFAAAMAALQAFNRQHAKRFQRETAAKIRADREARAAAIREGVAA